MRKGGLPAVNKISVCARASAETSVQVIGNMGRFHNPYILGRRGIERGNKTFRLNPCYIGNKVSRLSAGMDTGISSPRAEKFDGMFMQQCERPLNFALYGTERFLPTLQLFLPSMKARPIV